MSDDVLKLAVAVFSTLGPAIGLFSWWIRNLYKKLHELEARLDPAIELERNDLRGRVQGVQDQVEGLNAALRQADKRVGYLANEVSLRKNQAENNAHKSNEYLEKAKQFRKLAIQYRDSAECLEKQLSQTNEKLEGRIAALVRSKDNEWEVQLEKIKEDWTTEVENLNRQATGLEDRLNEKIEESESQLGKIQELDKQVEEHNERDARILRREGRIWEPTVPDDAPAFIPLSERRTPIISILNLKGGVGKTTLTANLAATLGHPDHSRNSLVVDLDYQRSLTKLCCESSQINDLHDQNRCIQHFFLNRESDARDMRDSTQARALLNSCSQVRRKGKDLFKIVACSEGFEQDEISASLDDAEMHLFAEWMIGGFTTDIRFRLRESLQHHLVQERFDYIFLDCPPRLSLAAINALAASDFVLIPILPDETSITSVPLLLKKIDRLRQIEGLLSSLKILGVVANKAEKQAGELIKNQAIAWDSLPKLCSIARENSPFKDESIHQFDQKFWRNATFGDAAGETSPDFAASRSNEIREWFTTLIDEIETRTE